MMIKYVCWKCGENSPATHETTYKHHTIYLFEKQCWESWPLCGARVGVWSGRSGSGPAQRHGHGSKFRHLPTKLDTFWLLALAGTISGVLSNSASCSLSVWLSAIYSWHISQNNYCCIHIVANLFDIWAVFRIPAPLPRDQNLHQSLRCAYLLLTAS